MAEKHVPLYWRFAHERYSQELENGLLRYVKAYNRTTGRAEVRSLRFRNFEVALEGSIYDFGARCMKRVLNIAGLTDKPEEAAHMVLRMTIDNGEQVADGLDEYVGGVADTLSVHVLGGKPADEMDIENMRAELSGLALAMLAAKANRGGEINHEVVARLMRRCGMTFEQATEALHISFGLNGTAKGVAEMAYFQERE